MHPMVVRGKENGGGNGSFSGTDNEIAGGFLLLREKDLRAALSLSSKILKRVYLALLEAQHRFHRNQETAKRSGKPIPRSDKAFGEAEIARAAGSSEGNTVRALGKLEALGIVQWINGQRRALLSPGKQRVIPMPRKMARLMAKTGTRAEIDTFLVVCYRCLRLRRRIDSGASTWEIRNRGSLKLSDIPGNRRSTGKALAELGRMGWISRLSTHGHKIRSGGFRYDVNLVWGVQKVTSHETDYSGTYKSEAGDESQKVTSLVPKSNIPLDSYPSSSPKKKSRPIPTCSGKNGASPRTGKPEEEETTKVVVGDFSAPEAPPVYVAPPVAEEEEPEEEEEEDRTREPLGSGKCPHISREDLLVENLRALREKIGISGEYEIEKFYWYAAKARKAKNPGGLMRNLVEDRRSADGDWFRDMLTNGHDDAGRLLKNESERGQKPHLFASAAEPVSIESAVFEELDRQFKQIKRVMAKTKCTIVEAGRRLFKWDESKTNEEWQKYRIARRAGGAA